MLLYNFTASQSIENVTKIAQKIEAGSAEAIGVAAVIDALQKAGLA